MSVLWLSECHEILWPDMKVTTAPSSFPVSIDEARAYCDYEENDRNADFDRWVRVATGMVERDTERALITQTRKAYLPYFTREIRLQVAPVSAVTIEYLDVNGATQTLSTSVYQVNINSTPPAIREKYAQCWPDTQCDTENAVTVTVTAGYGGAESVPVLLKEAILVKVNRLFKGCGEGPDMIYDDLISGLRWRLV